MLLLYIFKHLKLQGCILLSAGFLSKVKMKAYLWIYDCILFWLINNCLLFFFPERIILLRIYSQRERLPTTITVYHRRNVEVTSEGKYIGGVVDKEGGLEGRLYSLNTEATVTRSLEVLGEQELPGSTRQQRFTVPAAPPVCDFVGSWNNNEIKSWLSSCTYISTTI